MEVKILDWDSEFFDRKVGEIAIDDEASAFDIEKNYDVLYVKSAHDFNISIDGYKPLFEETKVVFAKRLRVEDNPRNSFIFSDSEIDFSIDEVYDLAYESGKFSRFKRDENFGEEAFRKLYKTWTDNSLNRKFADDVLLYVEDKTVKGFITYKVDRDFATVGLIAVSPKFQGKGIGSKLIAEAESRLAKKGVSELRIPTQLANEAACSFYQKLGYSIIETTNIKHYWKI
jgi:dTDP-4-amino-4,6-dideoxy-D-galactose acyltransferase